MKKLKCIERGCRKTVSKGSRMCSACQSKKWRQKHPIRASYNTLKNNAKRRGKEFTLTLEQFTAFCISTDYIRGKGKTSKSYSIDREKNWLGYTPDNIRVLPLGVNSRKGTKILEYDWQTGYATVNYNRGTENFNSENIF